MIALRIEFLAGQFNANIGTNEGKVEWPLALWRVLRALVAGRHRSSAGGP